MRISIRPILIISNLTLSRSKYIFDQNYDKTQNFTKIPKNSKEFMKSSSEITKAAIWILRNKSGTLRALNYMCATLMHSISQFYPILSNCLKPNYFLINPILKFENFFKILKKIKFKRSSSGQKTVMKFHRQNFQNRPF